MEGSCESFEHSRPIGLQSLPRRHCHPSECTVSPSRRHVSIAEEAPSKLPRGNSTGYLSADGMHASNLGKIVLLPMLSMYSRVQGSSGCRGVANRTDAAEFPPHTPDFSSAFQQGSGLMNATRLMLGTLGWPNIGLVQMAKSPVLPAHCPRDSYL